MSVLVKITDFIGKYAIVPDAYNTAGIQQEIDEIETQTMNNLLGITYATSFLADASANGGVPIIPANLDIYNPIQLETCYEWNYSEGIKKMLIQLVYWGYQRENQQHSTTMGKQRTNTANSTRIQSNSEITRIANKGVASYLTIQEYICQNSTDYPDYEGVLKHYKPLF